MYDIAKLAILIETGDIKKAQAELNRLTGAGRNAERGMTGAMGKITASARQASNGLTGLSTAFAGLVGALSAREFIQAADTFTNITSKLKLVTGSMEGAKQASEALFEVSQRTRQSFDETVTVYQRFANGTKELGISQSRLLAVVETVNKAVTLSGASAQSAQAALVQLGQGLASGTLRGEELNSVLEQTPALAQALADGLGVGIGELRAMGAAGEITAEKVITALEKVSDSVDAQFSQVALTVGQAFTKLENTVTRSVGQIDQATGATASLAQGMSDLADLIDDNTSELADFAKGFAPFAEGGAIALGLTAVGLGLSVIYTRLVAINPYLAIFAATMAGMKKLQDFANSDEGRAAVIEEARKEVERLNAEVAKFGENSEIYDSNFGDVIGTLGEARDAAQRHLNTLIAQNAEIQTGTQYFNDQEPVIKEVTERVKGLTAEQKKYIERLEEKLALSDAEAKQGKELTTGQKERIKVEQQFGKAFAASLQFMFDAIDAAEEETRVREDLADVLEEIEKDLIKLGKAEDKSAKASKKRTDEIEKGNAELREEIRRTKGLIDPLQNLEASYYDVAAAKLEEKAATIRPGEERDQILREAAANKERARLLREQTLIEYEKGVAEANQQFLEGFLGAFERGTDEGIDYLKNQLKRQAFQILINATIGNVGALGGALSNVFGTGAGGSALGSLGQLGQLSSIVDGIGTLAGLGGTLGSVGTALATPLYSAAIGGGSIASGFGAQQAAMLAAQTAEFGTAGLAATNAAAGAGAAGGFGSTLAAAAPWIAGAAAIYAISQATKGEKRAGTGVSVNAGGVASNTGNKGRFVAREASEQVSQLAFDAINMALKDLGSQTQLQELTGALQTSGKGRGGVFATAQLSTGQMVGDVSRQWEQNRNTSPDAEKAFELYLEQLDQVFLQTLQATSGDFAQNIDAYLTNLGDVELLSPEQLATAKSNVSMLNMINEQFEIMGGNLESLSGASLTAVENFVAATGGLENFSALFSQFTELFYTEQERLDLQRSQLRKSFQELNVEFPVTKEGFRAVVESLDLTTEAGAKLYAELLKIAPAFSQYAEATKAISQASDPAPQVSQSAAIIKSASESISFSLEVLSRQMEANQERFKQFRKDSVSALEDLFNAYKKITDDILGIRDDFLADVLGQSNNPEQIKVQLEDALARVRAGDTSAIKDVQELTRAYKDSISDTATSFLDLARSAAGLSTQLTDTADIAEQQQERAALTAAFVSGGVRSAPEFAQPFLEGYSDLSRSEQKNFLGNLTDQSSALGGEDQIFNIQQDYAEELRRYLAKQAALAAQAQKLAEQRALIDAAVEQQGSGFLVNAAKTLYESATGGVSSAKYDQYITNGGASAEAVQTIFDGNPNNLKQLFGFSTGGFVSGAGTGTSDSIPAMLSNGEFVVNARSTSQMRPMLEMMNRGQMPMMDNRALVKELQMMREELMNMRAETRATAVNTGKSAKLMERFDDQDALAVRVLA